MSPGSSRGPRRESLPAGLPSHQSGSREQERVREALGQAVAKISAENVQEQGEILTPIIALVQSL